MEIKIDRYLNKLISKRNNGLIKVITGIRRCGKSYLLQLLALCGSALSNPNIVKRFVECNL